jgi:hypothetical protein
MSAAWRAGGGGQHEGCGRGGEGGGGEGCIGVRLGPRGDWVRGTEGSGWKKDRSGARRWGLGREQGHGNRSSNRRCVCKCVWVLCAYPENSRSHDRTQNRPRPNRTRRTIHGLHTAAHTHRKSAATTARSRKGVGGAAASQRSYSARARGSMNKLSPEAAPVSGSTLDIGSGMPAPLASKMSHRTLGELKSTLLRDPVYGTMSPGFDGEN